MNGPTIRGAVPPEGPRAAGAARVAPMACLRHDQSRACLRHDKPRACLRHDQSEARAP
jgi:hypothetical protein